MVFSRTGLGLVNIILGDEEEKYAIPKGGSDAFFGVYAYLWGQFLNKNNSATVGNKLDFLKPIIQLPEGVEAFYNLWEYLYNMIELQQPFNALIESILLNRCIYYLFYTTTIGLDMLEPSVTDGLVMLEPLASVNKIQVNIVMHIEDLTHKRNIHTVDNPKRTLDYIGNTEPGNFWYNYVIVKYLPEVPDDSFAQLIQDNMSNRYRGGGGYNLLESTYSTFPIE